MKRIGVIAIALALLFSCSSIKKKPVLQQIEALETKYQNHTGFVLIDPLSGEVLIEHNSDKYFTPASNTKILTLYTSLMTLGDSLPGLQYQIRNDSLYFWGTGDPSLLYEDLPPSSVYRFLEKRNEILVFAADASLSEKFGPGWSWDDYNSTYSVERSTLPVYGNRIGFTLDSVSGLLDTYQNYFRRFIWLGDTLESPKMERDHLSNKTTYYPGMNPSAKDFSIPFVYSEELLSRLLTDTLMRKVTPMQQIRPPAEELRTVYSIPTDSALMVMMQNSDNFIAEQLMMMNGLVLTDTLSVEKGIEAGKKRYFQEMPDEPIWVDGSGLSRYNLFTPRSIAWLWKQIYEEVPFPRLLPLIAQGGGNGTLKTYYVNSSPFIYGKTGTLSNNNALSGYLFTKKGKVYIFSMMHNNYPGSSIPVKREMERILTEIHDRY